MSFAITEFLLKFIYAVCLLFNHCEHVALTEDGVFLTVYLDLGACIFAHEHLVANLELHLHFFAVNNSAWSNCKDLSNLRLLFGGTG